MGCCSTGAWLHPDPDSIPLRLLRTDNTAAGVGVDSIAYFDREPTSIMVPKEC
jgi:hypothetical protein